MRRTITSLRATCVALALVACAKQRPLPVADVGASQQLDVATGTTVILDGTRSVNPDDPANQGLTYQWSFASMPAGSRAKIESPSQAITRFTADVPSGVTTPYVVQLVVRNKYYVSLPGTVTVKVEDCGANAPTFGQLTATPATGNIGTAVSLAAANVDDKDNGASCQAQLKAVQQLSYAWKMLSLPAGSHARLNDPAAVLPSFVPDANGVYTLQLVVTDSTGRSSAPGTVQVQVQPCGAANPSVDSFSSSPATPNLNQATQLTAQVSDPDNSSTCHLGQTFTYAWQIVALPTGSQARLNSPTVVSPSFSPDVPGSYTFRLTITDSTGLASAPGEFTVTANPCGSAPPTPIVTFSPGSVGIGTPVQLHVVPQDADVNCGLVETDTYDWQILTTPAGSQARINQPHASDASFTPDVGGDYAIAVTVTDSSGTVARSVTHVSVQGCGKNPPYVDNSTQAGLQAIPGSPLVGQTVRVSATIKDPDNTCPGYVATQKYAWTMVTRPAASTAYIANPTAQVATFTPDVPGNYQLQLVVTDATGLSSAPAIVTVPTSTCGFSAPTILAAGASAPLADPGRPVTLFVQPDDADNGSTCRLGQAVSVQWWMTSRPAGSGATMSNPVALNPTFTPDKVGSYQFRVVATDSTGLQSAPAWVTIPTTSCGTAVPTVTASPAAISVAPFQPVPLTASPASADTSCGIAETYTYQWSVVSAPPGSNAVLNGAAGAAASFVPDVAGDYQLQVVVSDSSGRPSAPSFVRVSVTSCATLNPVVAAIAPAAPPQLGSPVQLQATGVLDRSCVSTGALTYAWTLRAKPLASSALLDLPGSATPSFTPDVAGSYQLALVVTNGGGLASEPAYTTINVLPCLGSTLAWDPIAPITASFTEPDGTAGGAAANVGTRVALAATVSDSAACAGVPVAPYRYRWSIISRPTGSVAALSSASAVNPVFVPDVTGAYQIAAQVTDALGTTTPTSFFTLTTSSCGTNLPVVAISAPQTTLNTLAAETLSVAGGTATDADTTACPARFANGAFTYEWSLVSGAGASLSSSGGTQTVFTGSAPGTYTVQLVAIAANGQRSLPATQTLSVGACGSHAPAVTSVALTSGGAAVSRPPVGTGVRLTVDATDADNAAPCTDSVAQYAWSVVSTPAGSAVAAPPPGANPFFDLTPDVAGTYSFQVVVVDSRGLASAPYVVSFDTGACAPSFAGINASSTTPDIGQAVTLQPAAVSDACIAGAKFSYAWQQVAAPHGSIALASALTGQTISFTPDVPGAYVFQLVVTDSAGVASAPAQITLNAGTCGANAPTLGAISFPAAPDAGTPVTLGVTVTDHNLACVAGKTQPYAYQWAIVSRPARSAATLANPTDAAPVFVPDVPGSYQLSVTVVDALGNASAPAFATLTTSPCGANAPIVSITPQPKLPATGLQTPAGQTLALTAAATDADDACAARFHTTGMSYAWSVASAPIGSKPAFTSASTGATGFTGDLSGRYLLQAAATASSGVSGSALIAVDVSKCGATPPSMTSVASLVGGVATSRPPVGSTVTLVASAVDGDNLAGGACGATPLSQSLSYLFKLVSAPAGASVAVPGLAGSPSFAFTAGVAGTYVFDVTAIDSTGLSSAPMRVSVPTGACGPGLTGIAALPAAPGVGQSVALTHQPATIADSCVAGGTLSYAWSVVSRPAASSAGFANPAAEAQTFVPDAAGTYQLALVVTDSGGFSTTATTALRVGGCSAGPAVASNAVQFSAQEPDGNSTSTVYSGDAVRASLAGGAIAAGGCGSTVAAQYSYEWAIVSRPAGSSAALDLPSSPAPTFTADVPGGTWQLMAIVRDGLGNAAPPVFGIVTASPCGGALPVPQVTATPANPYTFAASTLTATTAEPLAGCPARLQEAPFTYAWSLTAQPVNAPAAQFSSSGGTAVLVPQAPGAYAVQVVARGANGVASAPVVTTVTAQQCGANAPAVQLVSASQPASGLLSTSLAPATLDANLDVQLSAVTSDADNTSCGIVPAQTVTTRFQLVSRPAGSVAQPDSSNPAAVHFVPDLGGSYGFLVTVTDSTGLSSQTAFAVQVSGTCGTNPPLIQDGANPRFTAVQSLPDGTSLRSTSAQPGNLDLGYLVTLAANVVDNDALPGCGLTETNGYAWSMTARPAGSRAQLGNGNLANPSFYPDVPGTYSFYLVVTDSTGLSSSAAYSLNITCGAAGPQIVDGALPAFTARQAMTALNTTTGAADVTIVRSDLSSANGVSFYPGNPIALAANVQDGDGTCGYPETFSYQWSFASQPAGSTAKFVNPAEAAPSFTPDVPGEYDVQLTVADSTGRSSTRIFAQRAGAAIVGVTTCGAQAPSAQIGVLAPIAAAAPAPAQFLAQGATVTFDGSTSSSPDSVPVNVTTGAGCGLSPQLTYAWSLASQPAEAIADVGLTAAQTAQPSLVLNQAGAYVAQLVVSAGAYHSLPATVNINSAAPTATKSRLVASPASNVVADGNQTSTITATILDSNGRPIAGQPVVFQNTQVSAGQPVQPLTFAQASGATSLDGTFSTQVSTTVSGPRNIVAVLDNAGTTTPIGPVTVTFIPGPPSQVAYGVQPPANVAQRAQFEVKAIVTDQYGNAITTTDGANNTNITVALQESAPAGVTLTRAGVTCPCTVTTIAGAVDDSTFSVSQPGSFHLVISGLTTETTPPDIAEPQVQSTPITVRLPPPPPSPPAQFAVTGHVRSAGLSWRAYSDANLTGYDVLRTNPDGSNQMILVAANATSYVDSGLADGSSYSYQLRADNTGGNGVWSGALSIVTAPPPPTIITLSATNSQVQLQWSSDPTATTTSYRVLRSTSSSGPYVQVASLTPAVCSGASCGYTDGSVTNGTPYYYEVGAVNAGGEQDSSPAGPATPLTPPSASQSTIALAPGSPVPPIADGTTANGAHLVVLVNDKNGAAVSAAPVTLTSAPARGGDAFSVNNGVTGSDGSFLATLTTTIAETKTITAVVGVAPNQATLTLNVDFTGTSATQLVFSTQPANVSTGQQFSVVVQARDATGNVSNTAGNVTLSKASGSPAGTLGGTVTQPLASGSATFTNLTLDTAGTGFRLSAAGPGGLTATSAAFTVAAAPAPSSYSALAVSRHVCTIKSGALYCWGQNGSGELGLGTSSNATVPTRVGTATNWTRVANGSSFTCGLQGQSLSCWGSNAAGQLGQGTAGGNQTTPTPVPGTWTSIAAGNNHACAIDTANHLFCWGDNSRQQAGAQGQVVDIAQTAQNTFLTLNSTTERDGQSFTAATSGPLTSVQLMLDRGAATTCASGTSTLFVDVLDSTQTVVATSGGIEPCTIVGSQQAVSFAFATPATLTSGKTYSAVLRETAAFSVNFYASNANPYGGGARIQSTDSGTSYSTFGGDDLWFQTIIGTPQPTLNTPTQVGTATWTSVTAGDQHTCGVQTGGALYCFGDNTAGQSGQTAGRPFYAPTQVGTNADWTQVSAGTQDTCGIRSNSGTPIALCFGANGSGQLGNAGGNRATPTQVGGLSSNPVLISAGFDSTCAVLSDKSVACFGHNNAGQLGNSSNTDSSTPVTVAGGKQWSTVAVGMQTACGLDTNGAASCWGSDANDTFGSGTPAQALTPRRVDSRAFVQVVSGAQHTCALRTDGTAWCAGGNTGGALGTGDANKRATLTAVSGANVFKALFAGPNDTCGITTAGALYCWGLNDHGQTGTGGGSGAAVLAPTQVGTATDWKTISIAGDHACGIRGATNDVYCWGSNRSAGVLGDPGLGTSAQDVSAPNNKVGSGFIALETSSDAACGNQNGTPVCWGSNVDGQMGAGGTVTSSAIPQAIAGAQPWTALSGGTFFACGLQGTSLFCWGDNSSGQVGVTSFSTPLTPPRQVAGSWTSAGTGAQHACAIAGGSLSCWGANGAGQLGIGNTTLQLAPVQVGSASNWLQVAPGGQHTCALTNDGALSCWGDDSVGQLGDGGGVSTTPVPVVDPSTAAMPSATPSPTSSTLTVSRSTLFADGSVDSILVTVRDAGGNPIAGQRVSLSVDGPSTTTQLIANTTVTDAAGVVAAQLSASSAGVRTITAAVGGINLNARVTFQPGPAVGVNTTLTLSKARAGLAESVQVTVQAKDANGNNMSGQVVQLGATGSARTLGADWGILDGSGTFATTISSQSPETDVITAAIGSVTVSQSITFVGGPAAIAFSVQPQNSTTSTPLGNVQINILDAQGNAVANATNAVTVALGSNPGAATLRGTLTVNAINGIATFPDLTVDQPGIGYTLVASSPALAGATSAMFNVSAPWSQMGPYGGSINALAVSPYDGTISYAATASGVFKTTNSGSSWTPIRSGMGVLSVNSLAHVTGSTANTTVLAATDRGMFVTTDGVSWTAANGGTIPSAPVNQVVAVFGHAYALTSQHIYSSTTNGSSWTAGTGLPTATTGAVAINPTSGQKAWWVSADGKHNAATTDGVSWTNYDSNVPSGVGQVNALAYSNAGGTVYVGSATHGVYKISTNNRNWSHPTNTGLPSSNLVSLLRVIIGNNTNVLYAGFANGSVYVSTDTGTSWTAASTGLRNQAVQSMGAGGLDSTGAPTVVFAGEANAGIFTSANSGAGASWTSVSSGLPLAQITAIGVQPANKWLWAAPLGLGIQVSIDGGTTWSLTGTGLGAVTLVSQISFDTRAGITYAATDNGLFSSSDGGSSWTATGLTGAVNAVAIDPSNSSNVYAGTAAGFQYSNDGGQTFRSFNTGVTGSVNIAAVVTDGTHTVIGAADGGLYYFNTVWVKAVTPAVSSVTSLALNGTNAYAGTNNGILASANSGQSFSAANAIAPSGTLGSISAVAVAGGRLYASVDGSGVYRSDDGAATWALATNGVPDLHVLSLAVDPAQSLNVYAGTQGGSAARSASGGK